MRGRNVVMSLVMTAFASGCGGTCPGPDPTSNAGNMCHLEVDIPFEGWAWNGDRAIVSGATIECAFVADEIGVLTVLEYETWIDWDELNRNETSDTNVAVHAEFAQWGCQSRDKHNFKTVANGWVVSDGGTSLWGVRTQTSNSVVLPCDPPER